MKKKLYRSNDHRILFGVCGGFADYFGIDPKYIRIGYLIFGLICSMFARLSILPVGIYVILVLAMPLNPNQSANSFSSFLEIKHQIVLHGRIIKDGKLFGTLRKKILRSRREIIHGILEKSNS